MPSFAIVDSHVHFWDRKRQSFPWLDGVPALKRNFLPADYLDACRPVEVAGIVFVQADCVASQALQEAEWVASLARDEPRLRGIVARASLENGDAIQPLLEKLTTIPLVKGVRRLIQGESLDFCLQPGFVRGVHLLHPLGLSFDLCLKHPQLPNTIQLVRQCPDVNFVVDHIAKPDIKAHQLDPWRSHLRELAAIDNVWCKLSGLVTEADHAKWTAADLRPYIDHAIECFGFDRVMFGSDWPVSTLASDYPRWVATLDEVLRGCSTDELRRFYVTNAELFYRL